MPDVPTRAAARGTIHPRPPRLPRVGSRLDRGRPPHERLGSAAGRPLRHSLRLVIVPGISGSLERRPCRRRPVCDDTQPSAPTRPTGRPSGGARARGRWSSASDPHPVPPPAALHRHGDRSAARRRAGHDGHPPQEFRDDACEPWLLLSKERGEDRALGRRRDVDGALTSDKSKAGDRSCFRPRRRLFEVMDHMKDTLTRNRRAIARREPLWWPTATTMRSRRSFDKAMSHLLSNDLGDKSCAERE